MSLASFTVAEVTGFFLMLFGHVIGPHPLSKLGQNRGGGRGTLCWGYDNSRAEWGRPAIVMLAMCAACGALVTAAHSALAATLLAAAFACWCFWYANAPPVSMPEGPRTGSRAIRRQAKWESREWHLPPRAVARWRCEVAAEADACTAAELGADFPLSGAPDGRQVWTEEGALLSGGDDDEEEDEDASASPPAFNPAINPNASDQLFRAQQRARYAARQGSASGAGAAPATATGKPPTATPEMPPPAAAALDAARRGVSFYAQLQCADGHWGGDYGGPHFLMPGLVVTWYVTGRQEEVLSAPRRALMAHYLRAHQQADGGWGTHIESPSTMMGTTLCYVALRLLRQDAAAPTSGTGEAGAGLSGDELEDEERALRRARRFMREHGTATHTASWAKFWLCVLGVMDWRCHNSVPVEMFLLPDWFPFHPGRLWCHCRMVYLPMAAVYARRFVYGSADTDPVTLALRRELYAVGPPGGDDIDAVPMPYADIDWDAARHTVAHIDNYSPVPRTMERLQDLLALWERFGGPVRRWVRARGLVYAEEYMDAEDLQTNYIDIGPVNKVIHTLLVWVRLGEAQQVHGGTAMASSVAVEQKPNASLQAWQQASPEAAAQAEAWRRHVARIPDYLWLAEDGMKMQGYNGSQCWDTSFAAQAVVEAGLADEFPQLARGAYSFFERTQILSTAPARATQALSFEGAATRRRYYRHISEGGWPFSTSAHGWPISDCTAEALKATIALAQVPCVVDGAAAAAPERDEALAAPRPPLGELPRLKPVPAERLRRAADVLLTLQNPDGGWATYENNRGYGWYEALNPSEVFGDIMIDYSYVECSTASIGALVAFRDGVDAAYRAPQVAAALRRGRQFILGIQRDDGSWYGSWACCFCYGIWFGIEGLVLSAPSTAVADADAAPDGAVGRACAFLLAHQNANGGWGEDFASCFDKSYAVRGMERYGDGGSGVVPTSWALLALMAARCTDTSAVARGVAFLRARQQADGDWPQEGISGVFNRACGITYTSYRNVFPIWALGRFAREYHPRAL